MEPEGQADVALDIEAYASNYVSHAKITRLSFVADKSVGTPTELDALRLAADEVKKGQDTTSYTTLLEKKITGRLGPAYTVDRDWVNNVEQAGAQKQEKLETELNGYKTNLIKESIRMGYNDLGDYFYGRGDLQNAFKSYVRTRDYCTTSKHIISMCLNIIRVSIEMGNFVHVSNYVQKAEQAPDVQKDSVVMAKLKAASGLAQLEGKKYKTAARRFSEVSADMGTQYNDVLAPQDVAVYGALCSLASFDRSELKTHVIDNIQFREYLEVVPEVREIVNEFYASKYASCLSRLERLRPTLALDLHLHDHVAPLYREIRSRALVQYTTPFTSVDLNTMAAAFNTSVGGLEKEVESLIVGNQVQARIDSHNKVLYARHANHRSATFQTALRTGEDYLRNTKALLLRANLLQHDLVQRANANTGGGRGRQGPSDRIAAM